MTKSLLISFAFCSLQFMSCKTSQSFTYNPQYPRGAELTNHHYGERMYASTSKVQQAGFAKYVTYCDTVGVGPKPEETCYAVVADKITGEICSVEPIAELQAPKLPAFVVATAIIAMDTK